jgi:hypothetical protein
MTTKPKKYPGPLARLGQDLFILLALALEAFVVLVWPIVEIAATWSGQLAQIPQRWFKHTAK